MNLKKELGHEQNIVMPLKGNSISRIGKNRDKISTGFFSVCDLQPYPFQMCLSFLTVQATLASDPSPIF
jgi:hypothetical protein